MNTKATKESDVSSISYELESQLSVDDFIDVLTRSTLSERRPVESRATIQGMLENADLIATARTSSGELVGVARSITDFHFCTYLSDLAVDANYQRQGIGKKLIDFSHERAGLKTTLILLAAPAAQDYYPRIGMIQHDSCWIIHGKDNWS